MMDNMNDRNSFNQYSQPYQPQAVETLDRYTAKTFLWMFAGLMVTFGVAWFGYWSKLFYRLLFVPGVLIVLLVAEVAVVLVLSARIHKMSVTAARGLFLVYAVLNGVVFTTYFLAYDLYQLIVVFGWTAAYFGFFAVYGFVTRRDLSSIRPILVGGLVFLLVSGLISLFLPIGAMERVICLVGIAVFLGFTAYDTQKIRANYAYFAGNQELLQKASIFSALQLYLDFINLFLYLLRFLGRSRN